MSQTKIAFTVLLFCMLPLLSIACTSPPICIVYISVFPSSLLITGKNNLQGKFLIRYKSLI